MHEEKWKPPRLSLFFFALFPKRGSVWHPLAASAASLASYEQTLSRSGFTTFGRNWTITALEPRIFCDQSCTIEWRNGAQISNTWCMFAMPSEAALLTSWLSIRISLRGFWSCPFLSPLRAEDRLLKPKYSSSSSSVIDRVMAARVERVGIQHIRVTCCPCLPRHTATLAKPGRVDHSLSPILKIYEFNPPSLCWRSRRKEERWWGGASVAILTTDAGKVPCRYSLSPK